MVALHICLIPYHHDDLQCLFAKGRWNEACSGRDPAAVTNCAQFPLPFNNKTLGKTHKSIGSLCFSFGRLL